MLVTVVAVISHPAVVLQEVVIVRVVVVLPAVLMPKLLYTVQSDTVCVFVQDFEVSDEDLGSEEVFGSLTVAVVLV